MILAGSLDLMSPQLTKTYIDDGIVVDNSKIKIFTCRNFGNRRRSVFQYIKEYTFTA